MKEQINIKVPEVSGKELIAYGNTEAFMDVDIQEIGVRMHEVLSASDRSKLLQLTTFKRYLLTIQLMNQFPEDCTVLLGVPLNKWEVPTLFANLVQPSSVKAVISPVFPNLIDNDIRYISDKDMKELVALNYNEFEAVTNIIESLLPHKNRLERQSLSSLRAPKLFSDVISNLVEDGKVHYSMTEDKPFYFLRGDLSIWCKSELNVDVAQYIMSRFEDKWSTLLRRSIGQKDSQNTSK